ncbi:MAG: ketoacyl-ACP synthase III [Pseudomonadota bacterium]
MYGCDFPITITGLGKAYGRNEMSNKALIDRYGIRIKEFFIDRFIGAKTRYYAAEDQTTSDLATEAARQALDRAGLTAQDLDRIIVATSTPDYLSPSTACVVQAKLGASCPAYDVGNACSGFIYALDQALRSVATGDKNVLVIGADLRSRTLDYTDRKTVFLYGDGAGAAIISRGNPADMEKELGFSASVLFADGTKHDAVYVESVGRNQCHGATLTMPDGEAVSGDVIGGTPKLIDSIRSEAELEMDDIDFFVFHQPNGMMLRKLFEKLGLGEERTHINFDRVGNTVAATVPIALTEAWEAGRLEPGKCVLLGAVGAGITGGAHILNWTMAKPNEERKAA